MAYAALISLSLTLEEILYSNDQSPLLHEEQQAMIRSLHEKLGFLMSFLEDSLPRNREKTTRLEGRIRDATYEAQDIIESHLSKLIIPSESASDHGVIMVFENDSSKEKCEEGLQNVIEKLNSISEDVEKMKDESFKGDLQPSITHLSSEFNLPIKTETDSSPKNRETTTRLEERIRDATYEAQDIIEPHMSKLTMLKSACLGVISYLWKIFFVLLRCASFWLFREREAFDNIEGRQPSITHPSSEFGSPVKTKIEDQQPMYLLPSSVSTDVNVVVGLDDDLLQIKQRLLIGQSSDPLKIIPIVGMGGIGKSTLAKNIYNDSTIVDHFDIRSWATVSQSYHLRGLLIGLVNSITGCLQELNDMTIEDLKQKLYQTLKGNRYLVVMDDVWDTSSWDELKSLFPNDNNGSRIILTTRQSDVATYITNSSIPIHHMNFLSLEYSWDLLRQKVFGEECCPPEFEDIGKVIAEKCKGLPLALIVVGGLLYKAERTRAYWHYVAENVISVVNRNYEDFMEILSWSYNHLPHHLRASFLYMGVFPKGYVIHVPYLIRLWVAEGFLKPIVPKSLEQVAKEYLEDLIDRNLIMVQGRNCLGEIKTCNIHDLVRDLCLRKAQEENFVHVADHEVGIPSVLKNCRRLSFHPQKHSTYDFKDNQEMYFDCADTQNSTIRSFLYFGESTLSSVPLSFYQRVTVFDTCGITFIDEFPVEIVELVNLRYIALIYNGEAQVPASISKLQNLETLIIFRRKIFHGSLLSLPNEIWKIKRLRHLLFDFADLPLPPADTVHWNLETICGVYNFVPISESTFPMLKTLRVLYSDNFLCEASLHPKLTPLHELESLKCIFFSPLNYMQLPASLELSFPSKLKKLTLGNCKVSWERISEIGSLSNLEVLKLRSCAFEGTTWRTKEDEFGHLKFLLIESEDLVFWETEKEHFPSLECLVLVKCPNLECIPSEIGEILTLQQIILIECSPSIETSANAIKEEQHDIGNDGFQLHIFPNFDKYKASTGCASFRQMYVSHAELPELSNWQRGLEKIAEIVDDDVQKFMLDASNDLKSFQKFVNEGPNLLLKSKATGYEDFMNELLQNARRASQAYEELRQEVFGTVGTQVESDPLTDIIGNPSMLQAIIGNRPSMWREIIENPSTLLHLAEGRDYAKGTEESSKPGV